jgi:hypothetical protein
MQQLLAHMLNTGTLNPAHADSTALHSLNSQKNTAMLRPAHTADSVRLAASVYADAYKRTTAQAAMALCCQIDSPASAGHTTPDLTTRFVARLRLAGLFRHTKENP